MYSCQAEILRYDYTSSLYQYYQELCKDRFGWNKVPKNSFSRWITESFLYENIDPFLPSTKTKMDPNPLVHEIIEDFPNKMFPHFGSMNPKDVNALDKYINRYLEEYKKMIQHAKKWRPLSKQEENSLQSVYDRIYRLKSDQNLKKKFDPLRTSANDLLSELFGVLAIDISDSIMEKSTEYALLLQDLPYQKMTVKKEEQEKSVVLSCGGYNVSIDKNIYCNLHCKSNKNIDIWKMLQRYKTLTEIDPYSGSLQAAAPYQFMDYIQEEYGVDFECFASPVNRYFEQYCSAFFDTDSPFGSLGDFFSFFPVEGSFEANPPFIEGLISKMADHIHTILSNSDLPLSFIIMMSNWEDSEGFIKLKKSKFLRNTLLLEPGKHYYREITQTKHFKAIHPTILFTLQNDAGYQKWMPTEEKQQGIVKAFSLESVS